MKSIILYYPEISYITGGGNDLHRIPYAILHLIPKLREEGFVVRWFDGRVGDNGAFLKAVTEDPLFVGISSLTGYQLVGAMWAANKVREINPKIPIIWGGWHASLLPKETVSESFVDAVCIGQGEETIVDIARALVAGESLDNIPGVQTKINIPSIRPLLTSLPKIPWDAVDLSKYGPFVGYLSSFGCPWKCSFCAISQVYQRKCWYRDMDTVIGDLTYLVENSPKITFIDIDDDNFFIKKARVLEFCDRWTGRTPIIPINILAHVNLLKNYTSAEWDRLRHAGIMKILIGAESTTQVILDRLHKHQTRDDLVWFVLECIKHGIVPELSFLTGFPDSDELEDFKGIISFLSEMGQLSGSHLAFKLFWVRPYPGTELYYDFQKQGWPMPKTMKQWSEYTLRNAPIWVSRELQEMVNFFVFKLFPELKWQFTWDSFLVNFYAFRSCNQLPGQRGI